MPNRAPAPQPRPNRAPARSQHNRAPAPRPLQGARCAGRGSGQKKKANRAPRSLSGVRGELAAAIRQASARYAAVPEPNWPDVDTEAWRNLEAEIDAALRAGDRSRALSAIADWERWALGALGAGR